MQPITYRQEVKFKSSILTLRVVAPFEKDTLNERAILGPVLASSTKKYHSRSGLSRRLNWLYGTQFSVFTLKMGFQSVIQFQFVFPNQAYLPQKENLLEPVISLLHDILYHPLLISGNFPKTVVNEEIRLLKEGLAAEYNDKNEYAFQQFRQGMFQGEAYALRTKGDLATIDQLTTLSLSRYYETFMHQPMLFSLVGEGDTLELNRLIHQYFPMVETTSSFQWIDTEPSKRSDVYIHRELNHITQSKLFMGYRSTVTFDHPMYLAMQLFNLMIGDSDQSLLFKTVRERDHLCYSIGSSYDSNKGVLIISMGVDAATETQAIDGVKSVIQQMQTGDFEDEWLKIAKVLQTKRIQQRNDSLVSIANADFYYQAIHHQSFEMDQWLCKNEAITRMDIIWCASQLKLDAIYTLAPQEQPVTMSSSK